MSQSASQVDPRSTWDIVIIGGGGHVGLPLAIAFADRGARAEERVDRRGVVEALEAAPVRRARLALVSGSAIPKRFWKWNFMFR